VDNASVVSQFVSVATDDVSRSTKCGQIASHRDRLSDGVVQLVSNVQVQTKGDSARVGLYSSDVWVRVQTISQAENCPLSEECCGVAACGSSHQPRTLKPSVNGLSGCTRCLRGILVRCVREKKAC
jgi:hypothetical protein